MSDTTTTTVIPRLDDESPRAHEAKIAYVTMGPQRSLDRARQKLGKKAGYVRQLEEWSSAYDWQATARAWDDQRAAEATAAAAANYIADVEAHYLGYQETGRALHAKAKEALETLDIKTLTPQQIAAWVLAARELEERALRIAELLPLLQRAEVEA